MGACGYGAAIAGPAVIHSVKWTPRLGGLPYGDMEKTHALKCASHRHKYSGDIRNIEPYASAMEDCDCDGYHTFQELYDHRIELFLALCRFRQRLSDNERTAGSAEVVWRSRRHSDGELCFGTGTQFVMGIGKEKGSQITYHIPIERWDEAAFATTFEAAPEWDGHSSDDVVSRLRAL